HPRRRRRRDPYVRLEQRAGADLEAPVAERLEHVAVDRPARERLALGQLPVDARAVPGQRAPLVPAPLLPPEPCPPCIHGGDLAWILVDLPLVAVDDRLAVAHLRVLAPHEHGVEAG